MTLAEAVTIAKASEIEAGSGATLEAIDVLIAHAERTLKSQTKQRERTKMLLELGREAEKNS